MQHLIHSRAFPDDRVRVSGDDASHPAYSVKMFDQNIRNRLLTRANQLKDTQDSDLFKDVYVSRNLPYK